MCTPSTASELAATNIVLAALNVLRPGIFISPGLLQLYIGARSGGSSYTDVIANLAITVIAPLVVGQLCQTFLPKQARASYL